MSLHFFFIPARQPQAAQDELNALLERERIVALSKEFVADGANPGWAVCVEVTAGAAPLPDALKANSARSRAGQVDYKQLLSASDFELFAALRDLRKQLAQAEGVPIYAVFTNEQLAAIVTSGAASTQALAQVEGLGPARMARFGSPVLACLQARRALQSGAAPTGAAL